MNDNSLIPQKTEDGSYTFFSDEFNEAFHSHYGAKLEAEVKFVEPTQLKIKATQLSTIYLLDICYGLGYNTAAALEAIWSINPHCRVELISLELNPAVPKNAIAFQLLSSWQEPIPKLLAELATTQQVNSEFLQAKLLLGDARTTIKQILQQQWQADAIFLDPFSPPKCPQLWTVEFLNLVANCLKPTGRLATYSCAAAFRTALSLAGLKFGSTVSVGRKAPGTVASFSGQDLPLLSPSEQEHLQTRASIPYRDPTLSELASQIRQRRQQEQQISTLESTSQWKKRWLKSTDFPCTSVILAN
jgi:tRNA U34 5-methylaminomethyl-2-thiouridine-forming methyltransferase MnmC